MLQNREVTIVSCDDKRANGESQLACLFKTRLSSLFKDASFNCVSCDVPERSLRNRFLGDYSRYFWLFWQLLPGKRHKALVLVNYLPLWNFLTFLLLPKNSLLAPITGSFYSRDFLKLMLTSPQFPTILFFRGLFINILSLLSVFIIKKRGLNVIGATPSVSYLLNSGGQTYLFSWTLPPNFLSFVRAKNKYKRYQYLIYTNNHILKSNHILRDCLKFLSSKNVPGILVAPKQVVGLAFEGVERFYQVSHEELLCIARSIDYVIQLSMEEAGFFAYEASICGSRVLGFEGSGCAKLPGFVPVSLPGKKGDECMLNEELYKNIKQPLTEVERNKISLKTIDLHKEARLHFDQHFERHKNIS